MSSPKTASANEEFQKLIKETEAEFSVFARDVAKLAKALKDAKASKSSWPFKVLTDLTQAANAYGNRAPGPNLKGFAQALHDCLGKYRELFQSEFGKELRDQANTADLTFHVHDAGYFIGPFDVLTDLQKECCGLHYAKAMLVDGLPLNAKEVVAAIEQQSKTLLNVSRNIKSLADEFESVTRVCVARKGQTKPGNLRAELPQLLKEMQFVRKGVYGRPQFVVELATLIKSDENVDGKLGKEFRLETAVIENSKNDSKSVFVPDKLDKGSGEGKYYQAISVIYR
ncbi:MAG: hypothetical protein R3C56_37960 [Pirellulaceae bacterium]